jgi:hypothetical protein
MPARQPCTPDSVHPTYLMRWASSSVPVGYYAVDPIDQFLDAPGQSKVAVISARMGNSRLTWSGPPPPAPPHTLREQPSPTKVG